MRRTVPRTKSETDAAYDAVSEVLFGVPELSSLVFSAMPPSISAVAIKFVCKGGAAARGTATELGMNFATATLSASMLRWAIEALGFDNVYSALLGDTGWRPEVAPLLFSHPGTYAYTARIAVQKGLLAVLKFHRESKRRIDSDVVYEAALFGQLDCLKYLVDCGFAAGSKTCATAASAGHINCINYLRDQGVYVTNCSTGAAAEAGQIECLDYLLRNKVYFSPSAYTRAAGGGNIECIRLLQMWARKHEWVRVLSPPKSAIDNAARSGRIECMKFLNQGGCVVSERTLDAAALGGSLECLQYARQMGCYASSNTFTRAAISGNVACIEYLYSEGCEVSPEAFDKAAFHGHVSCLAYINETNLPRNYITAFRKAAEGGKLGCMKFIHNAMSTVEFVYVKYDVTENVVRIGHLHCLNFMHSHCLDFMDVWGPQSLWGVNLLRIAAKHGRLDCVKFLHEKGTPGSVRACRAAAKYGHLCCLEYLHKNGCPWDESVSAAAVGVCRSYLLENGCPLGNAGAESDSDSSAASVSV